MSYNNLLQRKGREKAQVPNPSLSIEQKTQRGREELAKSTSKLQIAVQWAKLCATKLTSRLKFRYSILDVVS